MQAGGLQLAVRDSVHEPGKPMGAIVYDKAGGRARYKVWVYLEGPDLPYVKTATYHLHPTFPNPVRTVARRLANPNCALEIWTWGLFELTVEVEDKNGRVHRLVHDMGYAGELTKDAEYKLVRVAN